MIIYCHLLFARIYKQSSMQFLWDWDKDKRLTEGFNISSDMLIIHYDLMRADDPPN